MKPQTLAQGDAVVILSPSGRVDETRIKKSAKVLTHWGLEVRFGDHAFSSHFKLAGTDKNRLSDLQQALDDTEIKAIFCARGGYGLVRIIDQIDFSTFIKYPKWIIGFSDVTVLHNELNKLGVASLHAPMPNSYESTPQIALDTLHAALFDSKYQFQFPGNTDEIVGGNLAIIYSLLGTNSDLDTNGKVLLIEDIGEYAYNVDRMIHALKKAGKFDNLKGLIIGQFTDIKADGFGYSIREIIENCTQGHSFPIYYDIPIGHVDDNRAIVLGA